MNLQQSLKILELETTTTLREAKRAYKDLVRVWHPDRFQNTPRLKQKADEKLMEINLAFNYLRDYLESSPDNRLTRIKVTLQDAQSSFDTNRKAGHSTGYRSETVSPAMAASCKPGNAKFSVAGTGAVPRASSSGRYVLFAFLCVFLVISALVVYFLLNTDRIASMTRGMASETMEKIVHHLEKKEKIPPNDPSVQSILQGLNRETKAGENKNQFEIFLNSGSIIMTEAWWEENNMIMYKVEGGSIGIEKSRIKKIVSR